MTDRSNNFDALRFWAALAVLWSHAFPIAHGEAVAQPLYRLSGGQTTLGGVAVACFFVISGFLITRSFERSAGASRFAEARALRIMPALLVVLAVVAFVLGPCLTSWPLPDYFASSEPYRYVVQIASFTGHAELPGVFEQNPVPHVNDSLWTLRYEVACYVLVHGLGVARLLRREVTLGLYALTVAILAVLEGTHGGAAGDLPGPGRMLDFGALFLAGAVVHQWRVPLRAHWAWLCLAGLLASLLTSHFATAQRLLLPYLVIVLARGVSMRIPSPARLGDLSYGIYIYSWPVTQLAVMMLPNPNWFTTGLLATPITLVLAFVSWHAIEKRALALKHRAPAHDQREVAPSASVNAVGM